MDIALMKSIVLPNNQLQDQYDQIAVHTQKGIDFLEKYGHFVDARSKIEAEYASKLRWESLGFRDDSKLYFIRLLPVIRGDNKTSQIKRRRAPKSFNWWKPNRWPLNI